MFSRGASSAGASSSSAGASAHVEMDEEAHVGEMEVDSSEPPSSTEESEDEVNLLARSNGTCTHARQQRVVLDSDDE